MIQQFHERVSALRALCVIAAAVVTGFAASASAVNIDWVTVGNAGNAADPFNSVNVPGIGAVSYEYRIGKYEVTNAQYAEFLNAVAKSDPNALYNTGMASGVRGGIIRSGSSGSYTYTVKTDMADKPVNLVDWFDAARFSNWMTNGQGLGGTESGVYTLTGRKTITAITRDLSNPNQVFLPNENEWYKAAYHQPASQGGDSDDYWLYPGASNTAPTVAMATATGDIANPGPNVANYNLGADWNGKNGNVTTVGSAGPGSAGFYGTFDQGGNVSEWIELLTDVSTFRRGGDLGSNVGLLQSTGRKANAFGTIGSFIGFRVASPVPEPASVVLLALGLPLMLRRRRG